MQTFVIKVKFCFLHFVMLEFHYTGAPNYLSIASNREVNLSEISLYLDEPLSKPIILKLNKKSSTNGNEYLYETEEFHPPSQLFKILVSIFPEENNKIVIERTV